ncbi:DMT family transporter [Butyrivibrio sp. WCD2001]|uniref:DMT family transporter n=1 Tax=Butyrivibrio sp. WCD2001 TaxID=1280681 RepID=UPI00040B3841|nr:DMT family transporter [Butyrivibrio sp. WCD2001]
MSAMNNKKSIWAWFPVTLLTAFFCCVLWGSALPAIKIAYELFRIGPDDTASRLMLAGARFFLAGIMTIAFGSIINRKVLVPGKGSTKYIVVLSMVQTVGQYCFFFMSLAHITGVRGSIINASGNFFAIIVAVYLFHFEKFTLRKFIGCVVGFCGILLIFGGINAFGSEAVTLQGEGAMLTAAFFYALSSCFIKIYSKEESPVVLSGYQFMLGGVILFTIGFFMGGHLIFGSAACVLNLIYMGFISAGAYTLWGILLKHNPVSRVSILGFMNPVMGVVLSAILLGEKNEAFSARGIVALVLVAAGVVIVNRKE